MLIILESIFCFPCLSASYFLGFVQIFSCMFSQTEPLWYFRMSMTLQISHASETLLVSWRFNWTGMRNFVQHHVGVFVYPWEHKEVSRCEIIVEWHLAVIFLCSLYTFTERSLMKKRFFYMAAMCWSWKKLMYIGYHIWLAVDLALVCSTLKSCDEFWILLQNLFPVLLL